MAVLVLVLFLSTKILSTNCIEDEREGDVTKRENFIFWPDGVIPFYIESRHFDKDQQLAITSALAKFSFKTCLQFKPVFEEPKLDRHVLVLENPHGIRKCVINTQGHAMEEPHRLTIGFDCMASPNIDMMIMRALGFPFEHNRASRDIYMDVLFENVDQGAIELYTKEQKLPIELRALPYDVNSVMHFDDREYSKNGHRTFIFKNPNTHQNRVGLSPTDLQKINIVYGPECKTRDRLAKLKICSNYPVNKRRKREVDSENNATNLLIELENKNDTILSTDAEKNDTNKPIKVEKNVTNLPLKCKENCEGKNIARQADMDKLLVELVRKIRQVRRLSIALAKRKNKSTRTKATDEEMALAIINSLYTLSEDTTTTDDESISDFKSLRSDCCETANGCKDKTDKSDDCESTESNKTTTKKEKNGYNGKQFYSTQIRPARGKIDKSDDCESAKNDYATTKKEKHGCNGKQFYSTKIKSARAFTQLRNIMFTSTQYAMGRGKAGYKEEDSTVRQKREVNGTSEGSDKVISQGVSTIPHNASKIRNTTLKIDKIARKRFMDRGIFDTEDNGNIKVENYAAITLPLFGGIATENIKKEREMVIEESFDEKEIIDKQMTTEKSKRVKSNKQNSIKQSKKSKIKQTTNAAVDDIQFTSAKKNKLGTTRKVELLPQTVHLSQENKDFYGERIWPEGTVYFAIENNPNYDLNEVRQKLEEVNKILQTYTCVELQEINEKDKKRTDYIVLDTSADYVVGRVGGRQKFGVLELFEGGQHRQHAAMVVMSMLGFYFEAARHDRDQYVLVHTRHIRPDKVHHFEKLHADATLSLPYDYRSATHPPWQYWRRLGKSGISSVATYKDKDPDGQIMKSLGQNSRLLSKIDLVKINSVYGTSCFENPNEI